MTPDRALIHSILNGGLKAYNVARRKGIKSKDLFGDDILVFKLIEDFAPKGRLPNLAEVEQFAGVKINPLSESLDIERAAEAVARRSLIKQLNDGWGPVADLITKDPYEARKQLGDLFQASSTRETLVDSSNSPDVIGEVKERYLKAKATPGGLLGLSSPWPSLDRASLGLQKGELHVLFAKRKVGKTFGALAWVEHIWSHDLQPGENILVVSMEMPKWQIYRRLFAIKNKLDYALFREGRLPEDQEARFFAWCEEMQKPDESRPHIVVASSKEVKNTRDVATLVAQHRPRLVFVDAFYILNKDVKKQKWERTLECAEELKLNIASDLEVPVLASTQLASQVGKQELDADSDGAAFAKNIGDYVDASYGYFADDMMKEQRRRILKVMDAREFMPISLLINFDQATQNYSEIKRYDEDKSFSNPSVKKSLDDLPDFEKDDQLKFGD